MATAQTFIARTTLGPGTFQSPSVPWPASATGLFVQLDPAPADWVAGVEMSVFCEQSSNGGVTWGSLGKATFHGGALDEFGGMPSFTLHPASTTTHVRASMTLNARVRMGLQGALQ